MENTPSIEDRISAALNPEPPQEPPQEAPESPPEEPEAGQDAPEPEEAQEAPEEATEEEPSEDSDIPEISALSDLAEHLGIDVAELYNITIPVTTADGERTEISLSEWKDAYQARDKYERTRQETQELKSRLEEQYYKAQEAAETYAKQAEAAVQVAYQQLMSDFQSIDWNRLQAENPAEWAMKRQQFQERQGHLQQAYAQAENQLQQARQEAEQRRQGEYQKLLEKEREALLNAVPEFRNPEKYKAETQRLRDYMQGLGFQEHEIAGLADHRTAIAFRKAMLFDEGQKKADIAKKKIKVVGPKRVLKSGARQSKEVAAKEKVQQAKARVRKTGSWQDAADAISLLNL